MTPISTNPSSITMVTLKDGSQVPEAVLMTTMMNLKHIANKAFIALYSFNEKCKDFKLHICKKSFEDSETILKKIWFDRREWRST